MGELLRVLFYKLEWFFLGSIPRQAVAVFVSSESYSLDIVAV